MSETDGAPRVVDVPKENRFVVERDGHVAELDYHRNGRRFVLIHTGVPKSMEGHGIGGHLVQAAVDRAAREHLVLVPWCPFARTWLEHHPDLAASVEIDWSPRPE